MPGSRVRTLEARQERSTQILDVAAELLLRLGYRHVTVDDIAARAGIGKGTVYLHWKTKDELLLAVLHREVAISADRLVAAMRADARVVMLHQLTEVHYLGIMRQPLLRAMFTSALDVLDRLATALHAAQGDQHHRAFDDYLRLLAAEGLLDADFTVDEISYGYHAILHGYLNEDSYRRGAAELSLPQKARLLGGTVRRTFGPSAEPAPEVLHRISGPAIALFADSADRSRPSLDTTAKDVP